MDKRRLELGWICVEVYGTLWSINFLSSYLFLLRSSLFARCLSLGAGDWNAGWRYGYCCFRGEGGGGSFSLYCFWIGKVGWDLNPELFDHFISDFGF